MRGFDQNVVTGMKQISGSFYKFFIRLKPDTLGGGTGVFGAFCQRSGEGADPAYQVDSLFCGVFADLIVKLLLAVS